MPAPVLRPLVLVLAAIACALVAPPAARADLVLPPGFTARVYVSGAGFENARGGTGLPSSSTLAIDDAGVLYLARTGRRYFSGEVDDLWPVYRFPPGGARVAPDAERRYFYGPPLPNGQVAGVRGGRELFVTTFDRDRKVGVLYRMVDGRAEMVAGGTPERGERPLLIQPEAAVSDAAGHVFVADRDRGVVIKLDPGGRVVDPRFTTVSRPRLLAFDRRGALWVGADGTAGAPWQPGEGQIMRVEPDGTVSLTLTGPVPAGMAVSPGGRLFVADRHGARLHVLTAQGRLAEFARFTEGDAPRGLAFAPVTPDTERAGIAGDLFVITIRRGAWPLNEVIRIRGPFEEFEGAAPAR
jgi:hypothetical protein